MTIHDEDPKQPIQESPLHGYIEQQRAYFKEKFAESPEVLPAIETTISFLEKGDAQYHAEVGYHGPKHILSIARFMEQTVSSPNFQKVIERFSEQNEKASFRKCAVIAAILHDIGYYQTDPDFGTRKIGHEDRSEQFIKDNKSELGLEDFEVALICQMMEGTKLTVPLVNVNEAINLGEVGKSLLGAYDIFAADDEYLRNVGIGLFGEFHDDAAKVRAVIAENLELEVRGRDELTRMPDKTKGSEQIKGTAWFLENRAAARITDTGLATIVADNGQVAVASTLFPSEICKRSQSNFQAIFDYQNKGTIPDEVSNIE